MTDLVAEQFEPVCFVSPLGVRQCEEDLAFGSGTSSGEVAVDGGLGAFVGQVTPPAFQFGMGWLPVMVGRGSHLDPLFGSGRGGGASTGAYRLLRSKVSLARYEWCAGPSASMSTHRCRGGDRGPELLPFGTLSIAFPAFGGEYR